MKHKILNVSGNGISKVSFSVNDTIPKFIVDWFADWITSYIDEGAQFASGQTIQYGWSILQVELLDGRLKILGPDFKNIPIKWIEDISQPVSMMMEQKYFAESYSEEIDVCQILNTSIIGKKFDSEPIIMRRYSRSEDNKRDSGWFIGSLRDDVDNDDPEQLSLMSLYEISLQIPEIINFLWLPEGFIVILEKGSFEVFYNDDVVQANKDSYVATKYKNR